MKDSKMFYGWWVVIGSAIMLAVLGPAAVAVANIYQAPIVAEYGLTNSQFAISNSLVLGVGIFISPFITRQFTSGHFKRMFIISLFIYAFAYIAYGFMEKLYVFYALSLLVGFGSVSTSIVPVSILMNNWFIKKRGLALSLALSGLGAGGVIFSQLITFLINTISWRQTYMIYGALMLIIVLPIMIFVIKVKPEDVGLQPYGAELDLDNKSGEQEQLEDVSMPFKETITKPFFPLLIAGSVLVGVVNNAGLG